VKELNKTIQDLKMEIETIKKSQRGRNLEIEILGKKSGTTDASISNIMQKMEERISGTEYSVENMNMTIKENAKCKKVPNSKHPGYQGHNEKTKPKDDRYR
jgi:predicted hydrocarbon binding protein